MPELPELEIVIEVLQRRVVGHTIDNVRLIGGAAIVVRDLTHLGFAEVLMGATITNVIRRGKFLVFSLARAVPPEDGDTSSSSQGSSRLYLALNPKLTGRLQLTRPGDRRMPKTHISFTLSSGDQLRYVDQRTLGQLYLTSDLLRVRDYATMRRSRSIFR